nr:MAG TPA_asm: hypothetical protein [Caudoviricetes sp.]
MENFSKENIGTDGNFSRSSLEVMTGILEKSTIWQFFAQSSGLSYAACFSRNLQFLKKYFIIYIQNKEFCKSL